MARIRSIKPRFWGSASMSRCSLEARLLAVGLMSNADDDGRFLASITAISGVVFPHDDLPTSKIKKWLKELTDEGYAVLYKVDGLQYGYLPNFRRDQVINRRTDSTLPPPPPNALFTESGAPNA